MKKNILLAFPFLALMLLSSFSAFGQDALSSKTKLIVEEGKMLYKSEMASWYGTDLFMENFKDRAKIGGYFSYTENEISKCIFFSKTDIPKVIGTISFDSTYDIKKAKLDLNERDFTISENDLYILRQKALAATRTDTLFQHYKKMNLNLIPLISRNEKKVYVLTGPEENGVVIFGNDYLLTFDKDNNLKSSKPLHKNIIPINYEDKDENGNVAEITLHSHLPETGDFITATDICTLMLYEKFTTWKQHNVISKNYFNVWNCKTNELAVIPMKTMEKISKDQEKRNKKNKKE
jgi:hypothetical protein